MSRLNFCLLCVFFTLILSTVSIGAEEAVEVPLYGASVVRFATLAEAKALLGRSDDFIAAMSRFDRQCRLTTALEPTDEELLRFTFGRKSGMAWDPKQIEWLSQRLQVVRKKLSLFRLSLPEQVLFIQTTGKDEGNAAYCRYPAVVLPQQITQKATEEVERLLIHEVFHIMSVHDAALRQSLYELIGFHICDEIALPEPFANRKLTNPDAPNINCWIEVDVNGKKVSAAPILYANAEKFEPSKGGSLFKYLQFRLMLLKRDGTGFVPMMNDEMPVMVDSRNCRRSMIKSGRIPITSFHPGKKSWRTISRFSS